MAWNGSDRIDNRCRQLPLPKQRHGIRPLNVVGGLAVILIASLCFLFLGGEKTPRQGTTTKSDVTLKSANKIAEERTNSIDSESGSLEVDPLGGKSTDREINQSSANAIETRQSIVIRIDGSHRQPDPYEALTRSCDNKIAGVIYAEPGQMMIGAVDFGEEFEKQFNESLKTKLVPKQDATAEERALFEDINHAKDAIVKAMKAEGKTAGEILSETREQLREFWRYKQMIGEELRRYENDENKSDEDVSDLFDAANKMLKENGIEPLHPNDLTREAVRQYKFDQEDELKLSKGEIEQ